MKLLSTVFFILVCFSAKAQNDSLQFPEDFYGIYKGDLHITNARGKQTIGMEFHLNKTDSIGKHQYMLVYIFDGKRQERKYNLIEKDVVKGEYIVDENNGILLDAKLIDNTLYFMFEVQNNLITTTARFYKTSMDFEITFTDTKQKKESGTSGEDAVRVTSYPISGIQKAHLTKQ
ncbi:MAG: hypothetical protein ACPG6B_00380 [Oceanihabitans sp.]